MGVGRGWARRNLEAQCRRVGIRRGRRRIITLITRITTAIKISKVTTIRIWETANTTAVNSTRTHTSQVHTSNNSSNPSNKPPASNHNNKTIASSRNNQIIIIRERYRMNFTNKLIDTIIMRHNRVTIIVRINKKIMMSNIRSRKFRGWRWINCLVGIRRTEIIIVITIKLPKAITIMKVVTGTISSRLLTHAIQMHNHLWWDSQRPGGKVSVGRKRHPIINDSNMWSKSMIHGLN